jgi:hypothetical protein
MSSESGFAREETGLCAPPYECPAVRSTPAKAIAATSARLTARREGKVESMLSEERALVPELQQMSGAVMITDLQVALRRVADDGVPRPRGTRGAWARAPHARWRCAPAIATGERSFQQRLRNTPEAKTRLAEAAYTRKFAEGGGARQRRSAHLHLLRAGDLRAQHDHAVAARGRGLHPRSCDGAEFQRTGVPSNASIRR